MSTELPAAVPATAQEEVFYRRILPGDPLPRLRQLCVGNPRFAFDTLAGRYQLFGFFLSAERDEIRTAIDAVVAREDLFDDRHCSFFGVSMVEADLDRGLDDQAGRRFAWDFDLSMSKACGAVPVGAVPGRPTPVQRTWILVDPSLHVLRTFPMNTTPVEEVIAAVAALPPPDRFGGVVRPAPVLLLPNVFEPNICAELVRQYDVAGGQESGVHRNGAGVLDGAFKRRKDHVLQDESLISELKARLVRRVLPEIERLFFMKAKFIERHIVGCYAAEDGGHFKPHRDNSPGLTAHRRYAVSINLTDDFEGGEVVFPEYNMQGYKAPAGWAVVFPCDILHAVRQVRSGRRYAYLPFVYDEAGRAIRTAERAHAGLSGED